MNDKIIEFCKANIVSIALAVPLIIIFTVFGSGRFAAMIIYLLLTSICSLRFLGVIKNSISSETEDGRKEIFNLFSSSVGLQAGFYLIVFIAGTLITNITPVNIYFFSGKISSQETSASLWGSVFLGLLIALIFADFLLSFIGGVNDIKKTLFYLASVYCPVLYGVLYLLFLSLSELCDNMQFAHNVFLISAAAVLIIKAVDTYFRAKKLRADFIDDEVNKKPADDKSIDDKINILK